MAIVAILILLSNVCVVLVAEDSAQSTGNNLEARLNSCSRNASLESMCPDLNPTGYEQCFVDYFHHLFFNYTGGRLPPLKNFARNILETFLRFRGSEMLCSWQDQLSTCIDGCFQPELFKMFGDASAVNRIAYTALEKALNNLCALPSAELNELVGCISTNYSYFERGMRRCFVTHSKRLLQCSMTEKFVECGVSLIGDMCGLHTESIVCETATIIYETVKCPLRLASCSPVEAVCRNLSSTSTSDFSTTLSPATTVEAQQSLSGGGNSTGEIADAAPASSASSHFETFLVVFFSFSIFGNLF